MERESGRNLAMEVVGGSPHVHMRLFLLLLAKLGTNVE